MQMDEFSNCLSNAQIDKLIDDVVWLCKYKYKKKIWN